MKHVRLLVLSAAFATAAAGHAAAAPALEFRSVGAAPVVMYDAPSAKGRKIFVAPRGMPVEVVLSYGEWVKVRDYAGDLSWVEAKMLTPRRNVIVAAASARVRAAAEDAAAPLFTADKGVLLEMVEPLAGGWVKVRHREGQVGFVRAAEIWGE
jgi:SH3-like domain-containing protein